jgi:hypothetical protein
MWFIVLIYCFAWLLDLDLTIDLFQTPLNSAALLSVALLSPTKLTPKARSLLARRSSLLQR